VFGVALVSGKVDSESVKLNTPGVGICYGSCAFNSSEENRSQKGLDELIILNRRQRVVLDALKAV
jgi:hypothetical protein